MNISINVDGNSPILHALGFTSHYTIVVFGILFVYNLILELPNYFGRDLWRGRVTSFWDLGNIYNWLNAIWYLLWWVLLAGMVFTIVEIVLALFMCVRISF